MPTPYTNEEKLAIRKDIRKALKSRRRQTPTIDDIETREKNKRKYQEKFADPVKRLKKQETQRDSTRRLHDSKIPVGTPSTRESIRLSYGESLCREILKKLFPLGKHYYRYVADFLKNPDGKGYQHIDIFLPEQKLGVDFQDKGAHESNDATRRDIQKEEKFKFYGYDLITVPHDVPNIDVYIREKWQEILRKRLY